MRLRGSRAVYHVVWMGCMVALCFGLSYLEFLVPLPIGYYGVKLGLANCVTLFALYRLRVWDAVILTVLRVILAGLAFGGLTGMLYSLCGAALSLCVMILLRRTGLHVIGVSVAGGVAHNIGQIAVAVALTDTPGLWWYLPVLLVAGTLAGTLIGILAAMVIRRTDLWRKHKEGEQN